MYRHKRKRLGLPARWINCPRIGNVINDMFVPFKTPLDNKFDTEINPASRFNLETFFSLKQTENIKLIVNLTKTDRYYNMEDLQVVKNFVRIPCDGHDGPPTMDQVESFVKVCENFFNNFPDHLIGVHCTHGYNRTGFMIISYLYEKCDVELETAVHLFASARPPGIYKQDYLDELSKRYDNDGNKLESPGLPNWDDRDDENESDNQDYLSLSTESSSESDQENLSSSKVKKSSKHKIKMRRTFITPKIATFMEGVGGVSVVTDTTVIEEVQQKVRDLMRSTKYGFIGSQPVSMTTENIKLLTKKRFMVSWKADGTRYIMLIADKDLVYMFDRDNCVYKVENINFPKDEKEHYSNTLVDGEMVIDKFKGVNTPRYLIYDIMCLDNEYIGDKPFPYRLKTIQTKLIDPRSKYVNPNLRRKEAFGVRAKGFWPITKTKDIWEGKFRQELCHDMDGLIFQPSDIEDLYIPGKCESILKWKPPNLNSIDFLLKCEYVKDPEFLPMYIGNLYVTGENKPFGIIEKIRKDVREKYDSKIVECTLNKNIWEIIRERTDKSVPNHITTATAVFESITNPVYLHFVYKAVEFAKTNSLC